MSLILTSAIASETGQGCFRSHLGIYPLSLSLSLFFFFVLVTRPL